MQRAEQLRVIKGLMSHLDNGTNVDAGGHRKNPISAYTDPDRAKAEWQVFFQDYPQLLGLSSELANSGDFFTSDDLGKPIICTRDETGQFRAFLNVCRHRGTIIEGERRGSRKIFSCPFHAWGYAPNGDLVAIPKEDHFGNVDKSCNGLVELPSAERHGLLFACANPDKPFDIDDLLGDLGPELGCWDLGASEHRWDTRYDTPMNWKLAIDTFGETYHFNTLHRDTLAPVLYGNCQMYDTYRRNHRMALCSRSIDLLRNLPESEWHVLKAAIPVYYIFPNVQLITGAGGPTLVRVYPCAEDPNNSFSEISFYSHEAMQEASYFEGQERPESSTLEDRSRGFAEVIQMEDYVAAASSHRGALSGAQDHFLFGRNEPALHHYHNTYREVLGMEALTLEEA